MVMLQQGDDRLEAWAGLSVQNLRCPEHRHAAWLPAPLGVPVSHRAVQGGRQQLTQLLASQSRAAI